MRTPVLVFGVLAMLSSLSIAGFNVPSSVHPASDLQKAQAEARQKNKPIAFLYSNEKTDCPLCSDASVSVMKEFKSKAVIVYVDTKEGDFQSLPPAVQESLRDPAAGKYIPKFTIFDTELGNHLATIPYTRDLRERQKSFRDAGKLLRQGGGTGGTGSSASGSAFDSAFGKTAR